MQNEYIIGVVEDFNFLSLKEKMDALVISPAMDRRVTLIKMQPGDIQATLSAIKNDYEKAAPQYPFSYTFWIRNLENSTITTFVSRRY